MEMEAISTLAVGCVNNQALNTTRIVTVPFLTNTMDMGKGEELIVEVNERAVETTTGKRTWKQALQAEEKKCKQSDQYKQLKTQSSTTFNK